MELKFSFDLHDGFLPRKHTCEGMDISPGLVFLEVPQGAKTLALISDDPDAFAGDWVHWIVFNMPFNCRGLSEGMTKARELSDGTKQGVNDFGGIGWNGPCPPPGVHKYFFRLYALDCALDLPTNAAKPELEEAMKNHIIAVAVVEAKYGANSISIK